MENPTQPTLIDESIIQTNIDENKHIVDTDFEKIVIENNKESNENIITVPKEEITTIPVENNECKIKEKTSIELKNKDQVLNEIILKTSISMLREKTKDISINENNIMNIIVFTIEIIENNIVQSYLNKKDIALQIIKQLIDEKKIENPTSQVTIELLLNSDFISNAIDTIVNASKGKININKIVETKCSCFSKLFSKK